MSRGRLALLRITVTLSYNGRDRRIKYVYGMKKKEKPKRSQSKWRAHDVFTMEQFHCLLAWLVDYIKKSVHLPRSKSDHCCVRLVGVFMFINLCLPRVLFLIHKRTIFTMLHSHRLNNCEIIRVGGKSTPADASTFDQPMLCSQNPNEKTRLPCRCACGTSAFVCDMLFQRLL